MDCCVRNIKKRNSIIKIEKQILYKSNPWFNMGRTEKNKAFIKITYESSEVCGIPLFCVKILFPFSCVCVSVSQEIEVIISY